MANWQKLVGTTIKDYMRSTESLLQNQQKVFAILMRETPEKTAKRLADYKKERDRLDAIEAAKSPAQKLREKQAACEHMFGALPEPGAIYDPKRPECHVCGLKVSMSFARGYQEGHDKGYEAGQQSVDCEE